MAHELILRAGDPRLYHVAVFVAMLAGGWLVRRDSQSWQCSPAVRIRVIAAVAIAGLLGCGIPAYLVGGPVEELAWSRWIAPKTVLGGLLFGFVGAAIYKRAAGVTAETSDAFARGACLMMLIGRLGCIARHCCFGVRSAIGFDFGDGHARVPVQAIEATVVLVLFFAIHTLQRKNLLENRRLFVLFTSYGLVRFFLEFLREPIAGSWLGIGAYQWLALLLASVGVYQIRARNRAPEVSLA
jgi:phosphatidylglycerol:prolipoprotein diacylglycerol transferase